MLRSPKNPPKHQLSTFDDRCVLEANHGNPQSIELFGANRIARLPAFVHVAFSVQLARELQLHAIESRMKWPTGCCLRNFQPEELGFEAWSTGPSQPVWVHGASFVRSVVQGVPGCGFGIS
jgi:hypothetical protein